MYFFVYRKRRQEESWQWEFNNVFDIIRSTSVCDQASAYVRSPLRIYIYIYFFICRNCKTFSSPAAWS